MNVLQEYIDQHHITRYEISKKAGIYQSTLQNAVSPNKKLDGQTVKILKAVALTLNKTPGQVLDDLIALDKNN